MKTSKFLIVAALIAMFGGQGLAQGENLFKSKCNTCHLLGKNGTGPNLKGVKQKWNDAGEGEMIYEWVKNSGTLISSGKSKQAEAIKGFSASEMPPQQVSKEEVDQILDYVDNYVEAAATPTATPGDTTKLVDIKYVPNYEENLDIFYGLIIVMGILLLAIVMLSRSIMNLIQSDIFKNRLRAQEDKKEGGSGPASKIVTLLILGGLLLSPSLGYSLNFMEPGEAEERSQWLLVENADLWVLLIIDLLLLGVVMYLKWLFNSFYKMAFPPKAKAVKASKKVSRVLTDAVPIEDEHKILMDHEYDGIQELDNNLPPWWVWGFYMTIVFAVIYLFHYHVLNTGVPQNKAYDMEIAQAKKDIDAYLKSQAMNIDETNVTLLTDASGIAEGKGLFDVNCTVCHKDGSGDIGPNLTDKFWIYGNDIKDVFKTIKNGTPNGMPDHASKLNPVQLQQVASYVLSLKYKPGKAPQGKEYK